MAFVFEIDLKLIPLYVFYIFPGTVIISYKGRYKIFLLESQNEKKKDIFIFYSSYFAIDLDAPALKYQLYKQRHHVRRQ